MGTRIRFCRYRKKINASPQTSYYLASLTKTFASTIIMQLVEQGKLDLDAPISTFGIKIRSPGIITVRHLLSHTSEGQPGTFFRYNGYRFQFLGQVIRKVSGRSFKDLLIENILKPLDLYKRELTTHWFAAYYKGHKEKASRYLDVYSRFFPKREQAALKNSRVIAGISSVGDDEYRVVEFTLAKDTRVRVYGTGEGRDSGMSDFGGIENTVTGKLVWQMDFKETVGAGGNFSNRLVNRVISLPPGTYRLHYKTDNTHSFQRWVLLPPDHLSWGIVLYEEEPAVTAANKVSDRGEQVSRWREITAYQRLLDSAITGQRREQVVDRGLRLIMKVCFAIFMSGFFLWPVGKVFQYLKERKTKLAAAGKPKSGLKLRAAATFMAWLNGVLGIFYTAAAIFRGALEFFLENGYAEAQYFEVKLLFAVIPFVFGCISIFLVYFTFWEWRKRRRSLMGRWFYTVFSAASFVFVYVCYRWYLDLFV